MSHIALEDPGSGPPHPGEPASPPPAAGVFERRRERARSDVTVRGAAGEAATPTGEPRATRPGAGPFDRIGKGFEHV